MRLELMHVHVLFSALPRLPLPPHSLSTPALHPSIHMVRNMPALKGVWECVCSNSTLLQRSSQCLSVIDEAAYVFGGELKPREPRDNNLFIVNLSGDTSPSAGVGEDAQARSSPLARVGAASTALGGKLYVFGGRGGVDMKCLESRGCLDVCDTTPDPPSWSVLGPTQHDANTPLPEDRSYHSMTSDNKKTIYLHAGCPEKGRLHDLWAFDVDARRWKRLASAPGEGRGGTSIAVAQSGLLYRVNGFDGKTEQGGSVDVYNPSKDEWSSIHYNADGVNGPEPRSVGTLVATTSRAGHEYLVTMFGEGSPSDLGHAGAGRMFSDVWAWDVGGDRWHRVEFDERAPQPAARGWFDADAWRSAGKVVVHGGLADDNQRLCDMWTLAIA